MINSSITFKESLGTRGFKFEVKGLDMPLKIYSNAFRPIAFFQIYNNEHLVIECVLNSYNEDRIFVEVKNRNGMDIKFKAVFSLQDTSLGAIRETLVKQFREYWETHDVQLKDLVYPEMPWFGSFCKHPNRRNCCNCCNCKNYVFSE